MTVREFLRIADGLPQNASAVLRPQGRRLVNEVTGAVGTLKAKQAAALRSGRTPARFIPPRGTGITPRALILRFPGIDPDQQRDQPVIEALRLRRAERHPCPG